MELKGICVFAGWKPPFGLALGLGFEDCVVAAPRAGELRELALALLVPMGTAGTPPTAEAAETERIVGSFENGVVSRSGGVE
jgi:hypothetical protein